MSDHPLKLVYAEQTGSRVLTNVSYKIGSFGRAALQGHLLDTLDTQAGSREGLMDSGKGDLEVAMEF